MINMITISKALERRHSGCSLFVWSILRNTCLQLIRVDDAYRWKLGHVALNWRWNFSAINSWALTTQDFAGYVGNCSQRRCRYYALVCNHTDKIQLFNMLLPLSLLNSRIQWMRTWSTFIILGGILAISINSIVWRRRCPNDEVLSAAAAKREKRIGGNKRQSPPLGQPGKIWILPFYSFRFDCR